MSRQKLNIDKILEEINKNVNTKDSICKICGTQLISVGFNGKAWEHCSICNIKYNIRDSEHRR